MNTLPITDEDRANDSLPRSADSHVRANSTSAPRGQSCPRSGGERPLFFCNWENVLFIHYALDPRVLQPHVPFELDLHDDRAFVSLVAFTMTDLRPAFGGRLAALPFLPFRKQHFLNLRTYVRHQGEPGIHFLAEWMSDWLCVQLGPLLYGLPYRWGKHRFEQTGPDSYRCRVESRKGTGRFQCQVSLKGEVDNRIEPVKTVGSHSFAPILFRPPSDPDAGACGSGQLVAFLLERYTAFTHHGGPPRLFRIWHEPWEQHPVDAVVEDDSLLRQTAPWWRDSVQVGANHSPGAFNLWMGWPRLST